MVSGRLRKRMKSIVHCTNCVCSVQGFLSVMNESRQG